MIPLTKDTDHPWYGMFASIDQAVSLTGFSRSAIKARIKAGKLKAYGWSYQSTRLYLPDVLPLRPDVDTAIKNLRVRNLSNAGKGRKPLPPDVPITARGHQMRAYRATLKAAQSGIDEGSTAPNPNKPKT